MPIKTNIKPVERGMAVASNATRVVPPDAESIIARNVTAKMTQKPKSGKYGKNEEGEDKKKGN
jgi:hypothetical protein